MEGRLVRSLMEKVELSSVLVEMRGERRQQSLTALLALLQYQSRKVTWEQASIISSYKGISVGCQKPVAFVLAQKYK